LELRFLVDVKCSETVSTSVAFVRSVSLKEGVKLVLLIRGIRETVAVAFNERDSDDVAIDFVSEGMHLRTTVNGDEVA
jgi:hypothetical protein